MPKQRRFVMELVREALRLKLLLGKSKREIGRVLNKSKTTITLYISRAEEAGITSYGQIEQLSDDKLRDIIFSDKPSKQKDSIDFEYFYNEAKRPNVTLRLLWEEKSAEDPQFYCYSYFCKLYHRWKKDIDISMRQSHKAGEKLFIDYAGTTLPIVDKKTGEVTPAQFFVATLGASNYTYAEVTWTQSTRDFISSNINAFEYFGGVPEILVPDNLKSGVQTPCIYEPTINSTYREMAKHYNAVVIPTRVRRPKDKAKVEGAVLIASRWILAALRNATFFSIEEANEAIWKLLEKYNSRPFQKMDGSRSSVFKEIEKPVLNKLPSTRFVVAEWKKVKVNIDYHVEVDKCYYSVPYKLRGKRLEVRYTDRIVEVYNQGKRIASHSRLYKKGVHSTHPEHMPKSHRENLEWTPSRIIKWARSIGTSTALLITKVMEQREHPEQAFRSCLGIIRLEKKYSKERLENACKRSLKFGGISYKSVNSILEKGLDHQKILPLEETSEVEHENIRGSSYYQ